jgi:small subunit ribosomal protein S21
MIKIKAKGNESVESMIRRFKKLCDKEGIIRDIKRNMCYEKPSDARRRKHRRAIKRAEKEREQSGPSPSF